MKWRYNEKRIGVSRMAPSPGGPDPALPNGYSDVYQAFREEANVTMLDGAQNSPPRARIRLQWQNLCGEVMRSRMTVKVLRFDTGQIRAKIADEKSFPSGNYVESDSKEKDFSLHHNKYVLRLLWKYDTAYHGVKRGATLTSYGITCTQTQHKCRFEPLEPGAPRQ